MARVKDAVAFARVIRPLAMDSNTLLLTTIWASYPNEDRSTYGLYVSPGRSWYLHLDVVGSASIP